ncbi:hypothetical protein PILCRDRAFT_113444 [Piloderma croceum F 1598]|uniref:Uncharacterized protein n=1 Tax=Piloderma croceum (strain F 1598) TaxID=765440 RepID=A0A0C3C012_PILCF|nr:hypothetical protein PILCRDRAFT_113444 [Piloderma croceum F 1598]
MGLNPDVLFRRLLPQFTTPQSCAQHVQRSVRNNYQCTKHTTNLHYAHMLAFGQPWAISCCNVSYILLQTKITYNISHENRGA